MFFLFYFFLFYSISKNHLFYSIFVKNRRKIEHVSGHVFYPIFRFPSIFLFLFSQLCDQRSHRSGPLAAIMPRNTKYRRDILADIVGEVLPRGQLGWQRVAAIYRERTNESEERDVEKLKKYWRYKCCNNYKKVTGSAGNPSEDIVARCNLIHERILRQGNSVALGLTEPDEDDDDDDFEDDDGYFANSRDGDVGGEDDVENGDDRMANPTIATNEDVAYDDLAEELAATSDDVNNSSPSAADQVSAPVRELVVLGAASSAGTSAGNAEHTPRAAATRPSQQSNLRAGGKKKGFTEKTKNSNSSVQQQRGSIAKSISGLIDIMRDDHSNNTMIDESNNEQRRQDRMMTQMQTMMMMKMWKDMMSSKKKKKKKSKQKKKKKHNNKRRKTAGESENSEIEVVDGSSSDESSDSSSSSDSDSL